jgi:uncharacterized protein (TIGR03435 family)
MRLYKQDMSNILRGAVALIVCVPAFTQAPAKPEFEVASIRPAGPTPPAQVSVGLHIDGAQVTISYLSLRDYLAIANRLKNYQISGPEWMASLRYDIAAKLPAGSKRDDVPAMLQNLLDERFQLKTHHESKDFPVYALVVAKGGHKMKEAPLDPDADPSGPGDPSAPTPGGLNISASGGRGGVTISYGHGASFSFANNKFEAKKLTMPIFADSLARFLDRPVVDQTGVTGNYDFTLNFTDDDYRAMLIRSAVNAGVQLPPQALRFMNSTDESLFAAVQQLGLKLESRKAPLDVLVIDKAEKTPAEN